MLSLLIVLWDHCYNHFRDEVPEARELKVFVQGYRVKKWWNQDSNQSQCFPRHILFWSCTHASYHVVYSVKYRVAQLQLEFKHYLFICHWKLCDNLDLMRKNIAVTIKEIDRKKWRNIFPYVSALEFFILILLEILIYICLFIRKITSRIFHVPFYYKGGSQVILF